MLRRVAFVADLGGMAGSSAGRYIEADDGLEYAVKGPAVAPDQPYVALNEFTGALLARALEIPHLDFVVVEWEGELLFGSRRMEAGTWAPRTSTGHVVQATNRDVLYKVAALDTWILNGDRTVTNLLTRTLPASSRSAAKTLSTMTLYVWDHSQAPIAPEIAPDDLPKDPSQLAGYLNAPAPRFVQLAYIRDAIRDIGQLSDAIASVEALSDQELRAMLELIPEPMFPKSTDRNSLVEFLTARRTRLRQLFDDARDTFPLGGGSL